MTNCTPRVLPLFGLLSVAVLSAPAAAFEVLTDTDYVAVAFEAEDGESIDPRWVLTRPDTPDQLNDPDPNHALSAVGQAYLELLPDFRVTHDDPIGPQSYWRYGGEGPMASYPVEFPEEGRYFVHGRALATGAEDNGLHVGLNGEWPNSGARLQFCTANQGWQWRSHQRHTGGRACGLTHTVYLDVPSAGPHTVQISAREDGFELDRMILIKDLSNNTRICEPRDEGAIQCRNGSIEQPDGEVDLAVTISTDNDPTTAVEGEEGTEADAGLGLSVGDSIQVSVEVRNEDYFDVATGGELTIDLHTAWLVSGLADDCTAGTDTLICNVGRLPPSQETGQVFAFSLTALQSGGLSIDATIEPDETDNKALNDTDERIIEVAELVSDTDVSVRATSVPLILGQYDRLGFVLSNQGDHAARGVVLEVTLPQSLQATFPGACEVGDVARCTIADLEPGASFELSLLVTPMDEGGHSVSASVQADNDIEPINDTVLITLLASPQPNTPTTDPVLPPVSPAPITPSAPDTSEPDASEPVAAKSSSGSGAAGFWWSVMIGWALLRRRRAVS